MFRAFSKKALAPGGAVMTAIRVDAGMRAGAAPARPIKALDLVDPESAAAE